MGVDARKTYEVMLTNGETVKVAGVTEIVEDLNLLYFNEETGRPVAAFPVHAILAVLDGRATSS